MADSIVRLRVDSQEYDNKLKRAAEGLNRYIEGCRKAGGTLEHVDEGVKEFTQQLGKMGTVAGGAKGKLGEMTKAFTDLTMQFNAMSEAEKRGQFGKALSAGLDDLKQRIISTKKELADINSSLSDGVTGGGGLFGGDKLSGMLQVFGGNVMTKIAGMGLGLAGELKDMVTQGIELARAGEGIRIAFERLGRGDILQGLREATHGTVTDLELMKAAVKFNDFKLPLDELGTMLAFAQQKAKDTGQSVDYLVESIVNGLGRKSLMILDNLGLSATEVKERMAETGDMTKAVGAIIREQMQKAGDYIETAADRAAQANVSLQNKMEELGRKFAPVEEASNQLWTSIKIGILDIVGGPLAELLNGLTEAGRLRNELNNINGSGPDSKVTNQLKKLKAAKTAGASDYMLKSMQSGVIEGYNREIIALDTQIKQLRRKAGEDMEGNMATRIEAQIKDLTTRQNAYRSMIADYQKGSNSILSGTPTNDKPVPVVITPTGGGSGGSNNEPDLSKITFDPNKAALGAIKADDGGTSDAFKAYVESLKQQTDVVTEMTTAFESLNKAEGIDPKEQKQSDKKKKEPVEELSKALNGLTSIRGGLEGMGIKLPAEIEKGLNVVQGLISIIEGVQAIISIFSTSTQTANTIAVSANTVALGALTSAVIANTATNFLPFAHGGVVPHAANGYFVPGTHYSADVTPIMANAGELVLNKSSQNNLANELKGAEALVQTLDRYQTSIMRGSQIGSDSVSMGAGIFGNLRLSAEVSAEQLYFILKNNRMRTGRGEFITTNFSKNK